MKKFYKRITILILILPIAGFQFLLCSYPKMEAPEEARVELTSSRLKRGKYLAHHVAVCIDCHSTREWKKFAGPLIPESIGAGGEVFDQKIGFPGFFVAPNITPFALSDWTDGEILRAIASGVSKDGRPLFPVMPHPSYGRMAKEDLYSIIAYLRTLKPIQKENPISKADFPFSIILRMIPKPATFGPTPDKQDKIASGKYLFNAAACADCHSKQEKGKPIKGMELAGGFVFPLPNGTKVLSANITPDKETGIGNWTEEQFINRFKAMELPKYKPHAVNDGEFQTVMPWTMYAGMSKEDLGAIFSYLKSVPAIKNKI